MEAVEQSTNHNQLQIINKVFNGHKVRVVMIDKDPWFVVSDICKLLDISSTNTVLKRLDDDEYRFLVGVDTIDPLLEMSITPESGLYNIILTSRKQEAKDFKRWITHDILPDIRKHGMYMTENKIQDILRDPDTFIQLVQEYKQIQIEKKRIENELTITTIQLHKKEEQVIYAERTKAYINDKKTATAMNTASQLSKKVHKLETKLDEAKSSSTVSRVVSTMKEKHIDHPILKLNECLFGKALSKFSRERNIFIQKLSKENMAFPVNIYDSRAWYNLYDISLEELFD